MQPTELRARRDERLTVGAHRLHCPTPGMARRPCAWESLSATESRPAWDGLRGMLGLGHDRGDLAGRSLQLQGRCAPFRQQSLPCAGPAIRPRVPAAVTPRARRQDPPCRPRRLLQRPCIARQTPALRHWRCWTSARGRHA